LPDKVDITGVLPLKSFKSNFVYKPAYNSLLLKEVKLELNLREFAALKPYYFSYVYIFLFGLQIFGAQKLYCTFFCLIYSPEFIGSFN